MTCNCFEVMAAKVQAHLLKHKPETAVVDQSWSDQPQWVGQAYNLATGKEMVNLGYKVAWRVQKKNGEAAKNLTRKECSVFMDYCPFCGTPLHPENVTVVDEVKAERKRQMEKGYTASHDDEHACDEIAAMAAFYIMPEACRDWALQDDSYGSDIGDAIIPAGWPAQSRERDRREDLIKGIAMAIAEVERMDRAETEALKP